MALNKSAPKASPKKAPPAAAPAPTQSKSRAAAKPAAAAAPEGRAATPSASPSTSTSGTSKSGSATPATVSLKMLAAEFATQHSVPRSQADTMLSDIMGMLVQHLKSGDRLRLGGLGILEVKNRPARTGRNPATGAPIEIKASKKIAFRAAKELKDAI